MINTIPKNARTVTRAAFTKRLAALLLLLFTHITLYAQLTVTATPTNATCTVPGSVNISVQNAAPGVPVTYGVYLLPNTANAVYSGPNNNVTNLQPGNYEVTAQQVIGGAAQTASVLIQISSPSSPPVDFTLLSESSLCGTNGKLSVNVTSGIAATYEVIAGPVTKPPQTSPVFNDMPHGLYQVKVTDPCGNTAVKQTVILSGASFIVWNGSMPYDYRASCNSVIVSHSISAGGNTPIPYPLRLEFSGIGPAASPTIYQDIATGDPWGITIEQEIPVVVGEENGYTLKVIYPCGIASTSLSQTDSFEVRDMAVLGSFGDAACGQKYLKLLIKDGVPPYEVTFTDPPAGFDPAAFNSNYGNPFNTNTIDFGSPTMPAPTGLYQVKITDSCGSITERALSLQPVTQPVDETFNNDCVNQLGRAKVTIPILTLATAVITSGPADYAPGYPHDVTSLIDPDGVLWVYDMPVGDYNFELTDQCGLPYTELVIIRPYVSSLMEGTTKPDCTAGNGTIHMYAQNPPLDTVKILQAPDDFPFPLPYDVSFNINPDGSFYMDNLPGGAYYIRGYDTCSAELGRPFNINVVGLSAIENNVEVTPQCGSFDLNVKYTGTDSALATFWLQKEITPGVWGHPATGIVYQEGTVPTAANSFSVTPNTLITGNTWLGHFRVVKHFETFGSGTVKSKNCIDVLDDFIQAGSLEVTGISIVSCPGPTANVRIDSNGVPPVNHKIIRRNNISFSVYNGDNPVFANLTPAIYTFEIKDACGGVVVMDFDVQALPPLVVANTPANLFTCDIGNDGTEIFDLTLQNAAILGTQNPDDYTIQYFATQEEADLDWHPLPLTYNSGPATIYVRIVNKSDTSCYASTAFRLGLYNAPVLQMPDRFAYCENDNVTITADAGYVQYEWSTSPPVYTQSITVDEPGSYKIKVTDINGCTGEKTIEVVESPNPHISRVDKTDWTGDSNTITVYVETSPIPQEFEYSLDGVNYQQSNTFTGLKPGRHFVFVRDVFHCGIDYREVYLLAAPPFFSPNGDGVNDTWRIDYAITEPGMEAFIFDRYGRLLYSFDANSKGWDGSFNGLPLPASDYWYVIKRSTGQEYRGHFSLMR